VARAPDRLTYTILDFMFENYAPMLDELSLEIGRLEDSIIKTTSVATFEDILNMKTKLQKVRQIVVPQREVLTRLAHGEFKIVRQHMLPYYRDLLDQLSRIAVQADNYRDSLTNVLQVNLNLRQMEVNRVIKVLTVMATLFMPILVVTSFYGMNINHWPTFHYNTPEAYGWVFAITGFMTVVLYLILRRKGWW
jgi:magnesium transporter